jgi:hypothetical protein
VSFCARNGVTITFSILIKGRVGLITLSRPEVVDSNLISSQSGGAARVAMAAPYSINLKLVILSTRIFSTLLEGKLIVAEYIPGGHWHPFFPGSAAFVYT